MSGTNHLDKWTAVLDYLVSGFNGAPVEGTTDARDRRALVSTFRVKASTGHYLLMVSHEFLDDHTADDVTRLLGEWRVAERLQEAGSRTLLVSNHGPRLLEE